MTLYVAKMGKLYFRDWIKLRDYHDFMVTDKIQDAGLWYEKGKSPTTAYLNGCGFEFIKLSDEDESELRKDEFGNSKPCSNNRFVNGTNLVKYGSQALNHIFSTGIR